MSAGEGQVAEAVRKSPTEASYPSSGTELSWSAAKHEACSCPELQAEPADAKDLDW